MLKIRFYSVTSYDDWIKTYVFSCFRVVIHYLQQDIYRSFNSLKRAHARIIEYLSDGITLEPGDVIATGTVAGISHSWGEYLKIGDQLECEITSIGKLQSEIIKDQYNETSIF